MHLFPNLSGRLNFDGSFAHVYVSRGRTHKFVYISSTIYSLPFLICWYRRLPGTSISTITIEIPVTVLVDADRHHASRGVILVIERPYINL